MFLSNANEKSQNRQMTSLQGHWTLGLNQEITLEKSKGFNVQTAHTGHSLIVSKIFQIGSLQSLR